MKDLELYSRASKSRLLNRIKEYESSKNEDDSADDNEELNLPVLNDNCRSEHDESHRNNDNCDSEDDDSYGNDEDDDDNNNLDNSDTDNSDDNDDVEEELSSDDDSSSEDENEAVGHHELNFDSPLYEDAPLTFGASTLLILMLVIRHKISDTLLTDILNIIRLHCKVPNLCFTSLYRLKKFFDEFNLNFKRHYFCSNCLKKMKNSKDRCLECTDSESCYFIEVPLIPQLLKLSKRDGFYDSLNARFTTPKKSDNCYEDIWDGNIYKSLRGDNGFLAHKNNFSFTWNTDGIALYKSSKFNIWPSYLTINELPFQMRTKLSNVLIAGFWFGFKKPATNFFMNSFQDNLQKIHKGIFVEVPNHQHPIKIRGITICGTCDLPAKASFLNMKGHTAIYGCCRCKIKSKKVGNFRAFPYKKELDLRTTEETITQGNQAFITGQPVEGVKGPTALCRIVLNFIESTSIDSMHCIYLGITKSLLRFWFASEFNSFDFSLRKSLSDVNKKIQSIKPPSYICRLPRSITDYKYWKASEFKHWLLYYSLIILRPIMSTNYYNHHKKLVLGVSLLSQESISTEMIGEASKLLHKYVRDFKKLYGLQYMTCNLHQLLHLPDVVRELGPLHITSCFPYENLNGVLKRLVHGTRYAQLQIGKMLSRFYIIAELTRTQLHPESEVAIFCDQLEKSNLCRRKLTVIMDGLAIIGKISPIKNVSNSIKNALEACNIKNYNRLCLFHRLYKQKLFLILEVINVRDERFHS